MEPAAGEEFWRSSEQRERVRTPVMVAVAVVSLLLAVIDYLAWVATVDNSSWGTVTAILDWCLALVFVACVAALIRRAAHRARGRK